MASYLNTVQTTLGVFEADDVSILGPSSGTERGGDLCHGIAVGQQDLPETQADASVSDILSIFWLFKGLNPKP